MAPKENSELAELSPVQRKYVKATIEKAKRRALRNAPDHRGKTLSLKFKESDIEAWRVAADEAKISLTDWVEETLNNRAARRK